MKRCGNLDTCTGCKKSQGQFFEKLYTKLISKISIENVTFDEKSELFKLFWHDGLYSIKFCLNKYIKGSSLLFHAL